MVRRGRRIWVGAGVFLVILVLLGPASALAATTSWEWDISSNPYPELPIYIGETLAGGGPTEPNEYVLENTGETPITIEHLYIGLESKSEPHVWTVSRRDCKKGTTIEPGQTCSVAVVFNPLMSGRRKGFVRAQAVNEEPLPAQVNFEGYAFGPWVHPGPERLDFGPVELGAGPSPTQTITLVNEDPLPLMIYGTSVTDTYERPESPSPFRVVGGSCREGVVVPTSASCTVEVVLEPSHVGSFESKVVIVDNAESRQSVRLQGVGIAPPPSPVGPGAVTKSEPDNAAPSAPVAPATSTPTKSKLEPPLPCPKGKRKAARQGKTVCVRRHRHPRHPGHIK